jgi:hypothetical protein
MLSQPEFVALAVDLFYRLGYMFVVDYVAMEC